MNKDTIRNFFLNGVTVKELVAQCATATLRDWNPDGCEYGSSGYIEADEGDTIDLHDEASVSAYTTADGAIMIATNGGDAEAEEYADYGVAELAALIDLRDKLDSAPFHAYYLTKDEKNDQEIKKLDAQIDYIDRIISRRGLDAVLEHFGLEVVCSSELPNAELLDTDPSIDRYADFGVKDKDGTVTVAYYTRSGYTICTWGQTTTDDDGNTVLEGFAGEDIEDLLATVLL